MKEFYSIEESLIFLNKNLNDDEKINKRDLLQFSAENKIIACFYYAGALLWREEQSHINFIKGYVEPSFRGYLTADDLGFHLHYAEQEKESAFLIKFANIYKNISQTIVPNDDITVALYDLFGDDNKFENEYNKQSTEEKSQENYHSFLFSKLYYTIVPLENVFFYKNELLKFKKNYLSPDKNKIIDEVLHPRTANNASKIISALCELNGLDITQPYGNTNKKIIDVLDKLGTPLSKDVVGDWLKLAHENTK